ncbi:MAG: ECF transporter S component [Candidatus Thorarchaeota archaeon]
MEYFVSKTSDTSLYVALLAILTALTTVATAVLVVPFPSTQGYFNLGDSLVMISGFLLGPAGGFFAGGVGSAMADLILGFPGFAPITFIAKGLEGLVVGFLSFRTMRKKTLSGWDILGLLLGSVAMLLGYLLGEMFMLGYTFEVAALELVTINSIQVTMGSIVTILIGPLLRVYLRDVLYEPPATSPWELETEAAADH